MNQYRLIDYEDDGHRSYQCLTCKDTWSGCHRPNYCPMCGVKLDGGRKECRAKSTPRWHYDRWGNGALPCALNDKLHGQQAPMRMSRWKIQERFVEGSRAGEWENRSTVYCPKNGLGMAIEAYMELRHCREEAGPEDELGKLEYRIIAKREHA